MVFAYRMCGLILAAGASTRMGRDKALLPWPPAASASADSAGQTLLSASVAALKPFAETIVVVAGKNADSIAPVVAASGASIVCNPAPERGQFSSLQVGLRQLLTLGCGAAIITLVDCPPLSAPSLTRLHTAFEQALSMGRWGVAPENRGRRGHPLFASRALIDAFLAAPVTSNARDVKRENAQSIDSVPVPDSLLSVDLNTPEQYAALVSTANFKPD